MADPFGPKQASAAGIVRPPAHAGSFYPADPEALRRLVDALLRESARSAAWAGPSGTRAGGDQAGVEPPLGLLVPHAGLVYSGRVAAAGWRALLANPPAAIVLVGTNHYVSGLDGIAVWPAGSWTCPLGAVPVEAGLAARIVALGPPFSADSAAHAAEHSLEVQLPFLAGEPTVTPIVPLLASFRSRAEAETAGGHLGHLLSDERASGRRLTVAVSSDLVHYPPAEAAERADRELLEAVVDLDGAALERRDAAWRRAGVPGLVCGLCGLDAVLFTLAALRAMGATGGSILATATSADVPFGDPRRTVGYGAVAFD